MKNSERSSTNGIRDSMRSPRGKREPHSSPTFFRSPSRGLWPCKTPRTRLARPGPERGRKRASARPILDGLIYHFRTGCQWNQIPEVYGDDSTIHRTFQRWVKIGLFEMIWSLLLAECDQLGMVDWRWQAADGSMGKARNGGDQIGPNPADRAKQGSKKSLLVDGQGGPLAIVVAPANVNDHFLLKETIGAIVVKRPRPTEKEPQHLCLDAGYDNQMSRETVKEHHYQGHIRPARGKGPARKSKKKYPPRRWVVERTFSWLSKCRGLLVRYEKKSRNYGNRWQQRGRESGLLGAT
jgi:putative transposase